MSNSKGAFFMAYPVPTISLGRLREELAVYSDDYEISFSGLEFHRVKYRGPGELQVEFNEAVHRDETGRVVLTNLD
jgi:hypothetical protein